MYQVHLVRQRPSEDQIWVDDFNADDSVQDAHQALIEAVNEFLSSEAGVIAIEQSCNDFNWGDAVTHVPDEIWNKHGLFPADQGKSVDIFVNQDEVLCD